MRVFMKWMVAAGMAAGWANGGARADDGATDILVNPETGTTISQPGAYRVVSDVALTGNIVAITITSDNVNLDLGGHTITAGPGSQGIGVFASGVKDVTVSNGNLRKFGYSAVFLVEGAIRGVTARGNNILGGFASLKIDNAGVVENCVVADDAPTNGGETGISVGPGSKVVGNLVENCSSTGSSAAGVVAGDDSEIRNNVIRSMTSSVALAVGINAGLRCRISGNNVSLARSLATDAIGIYAQGGALIENNVCSGMQTPAVSGQIASGIKANTSIIQNNEVADGSSDPMGVDGRAIGIDGMSGSLIRGNHCMRNRGAGAGFGVGINVTSGCRVEGNHVGENGSALKGWGVRVASTGNLVAGNYTENNAMAGLRFETATNNRAHGNQLREDLGIDTTNAGVNPASLGTGDLANVIF